MQHDVHSLQSVRTYGCSKLRGSFGQAGTANAGFLPETNEPDFRADGASTGPSATIAPALLRSERGASTGKSSSNSNNRSSSRGGSDGGMSDEREADHARLWDRRLWKRSQKGSKVRHQHQHTLLVLTKAQKEARPNVDTSGLVLTSKSLPRLQVPTTSSWSPTSPPLPSSPTSSPQAIAGVPGHGTGAPASPTATATAISGNSTRRMSAPRSPFSSTYRRYMQEQRKTEGAVGKTLVATLASSSPSHQKASKGECKELQVASLKIGSWAS